MAKKTTELQDLVQEIEDLIAELAYLQDPQIKELPSRADQNLGEAQGRIPRGAARRQARSRQ